MKNRAGPGRRLGHRADLLNRADFGIGEGERDQRHVGIDGGGDLLRRQAALAVGSDLNDGETARSQICHRRENRGVLYRGADDLASSRKRLERAINREVVGLGATAGENELARLGPDKRGDLSAGSLEHPARGLPRAMHRCGIAGPRLEDARDGGLGLGASGRTGIMIEIGAHRRCMRNRRTKFPKMISYLTRLQRKRYAILQPNERDSSRRRRCGMRTGDASCA